VDDAGHASGMAGIRRHNFHFRLTFQNLDKNFSMPPRATPDGRLRCNGISAAGSVMAVMMFMVAVPVVVVAVPVAMLAIISMVVTPIYRLWAIVCRWRCVDMAFSLVNYHFPLWFAAVIRAQRRTGGTADGSPDDGAVAAIQVVANHCTQCAAQCTAYSAIGSIVGVCRADQQWQRQAGNKKSFQHDLAPCCVKVWPVSRCLPESLLNHSSASASVVCASSR
jgi:hypothetical protein